MGASRGLMTWHEEKKFHMVLKEIVWNSNFMDGLVKTVHKIHWE